MTDAPSAPWCRIVGRVIAPDASPHGVGGHVVLDPDPETPRVTLDDGTALVASVVDVALDSEGRVGSLVDGARVEYVDILAPGEGVTPAGDWTYRMRIVAPGLDETTHVTLTQGAVVNITDLLPVGPYQGDAVTVAEQSAQAAAASAEASASSAQASAVSASQAASDLASARVESEASASSAQAAALSASSAEASASQAAADLATVRGEVASGIHDGTGVVSIVDDDGDGTATVTLTDGSTSALPLPRGRGVSSITNPDGDATALVTMTDGSTTNLALPTVADPALSIGSVTTVPAGGVATASVSGTYPDLRLNFGLVTGQPDDYRIVGVGRPDVSGSMSSDIAASVAAAPVGTVFTSTDGPQGAWAWMRTTTGWTVTVGDTGWRKITNAASNANMSVSAWIQRVNNRVTHYVEIQTLTTARSYVQIEIPSGYALARPAGANNQLDFGNGEWVGAEAFYYTGLGTSQARGHIQVFRSSLVVGSYGSPLSKFPATLEYATNSSWPTALPGTAA